MSDFIIENGVLTKYTGKSWDVVIPDGVTKIGDRAFLHEYFIHSVTIPYGVTTIGYAAFNKCGLKSVSIPDSVVTIEGLAFCGCNHLTNITIPDSVRFIGFAAFQSCGFTSVRIPDGVEQICDLTFSSCENLENVHIPNSVTIIGKNAFILSNITNIDIPEGVRIIEEFAFPSSLKELYLPDSVTRFDKYAFQPKLSFHNSNLSDYNTHDFDIRYGGLLFRYMGKECNIVIPDGVISIGDYSFKAIDNITSIAIPDTVISIGDGAFKDCKKLKSINVKDSIEYFGSNPFAGTAWYEQLHGLVILGNSLIKYNGSESHLSIPDGVKHLVDHAFAGCRKLQSITIPNSLRSISKPELEPYEPYQVDPNRDPIDTDENNERIYERNEHLLVEHLFWECSSLKKLVNNSSIPIAKYTTLQQLTEGYLPNENLLALDAAAAVNATVCYLSSHECYSEKEAEMYKKHISNNFEKLFSEILNRRAYKALQGMVKLDIIPSSYKDAPEMIAILMECQHQQCGDSLDVSTVDTLPPL